jgi:tetratricopeptide (TPR) repeat protein
MNPLRFPHTALCVVCLTLTTVQAADSPTDEDQAAAWEPVIVLTANAQVFAGDKPGPKIAPGTIVFISQRKDDWLLVPRYNSWLNEQHARSLPTALAFLNEQIEKAPTAVLHHYRAIVLSELGRLDESMKDYDSAVQLGLSASNVFLNRGLAWGRAGDNDRAIADFEEAIRRDGKNAQAYFNRGVLHAHGGRTAAAIQDFDKAIELDPKYAEAFNNRGVARQELGQDKEALADYEQALKLRQRYPGALTNRAYLRQLEGDFKGAIEDYAAALKMAPDSHPTLNDLAWLLATCPDKNVRNGQAALSYAERANQLTESKEVDYLDTLAAAAAESGDFSRAVETLEKALAAAPADLQGELQSRLDLYRAQQPFHETVAGPTLSNEGDSEE